jgi:hypothetical protein
VTQSILRARAEAQTEGKDEIRWSEFPLQVSLSAGLYRITKNSEKKWIRHLPTNMLQMGIPPSLSSLFICIKGFPLSSLGIWERCVQLEGASDQLFSMRLPDTCRLVFMPVIAVTIPSLRLGAVLSG